MVPLVRADQRGAADSLAEERRLFYVSLTRAKQRLRLSHTHENSHYGRNRWGACPLVLLEFCRADTARRLPAPLATHMLSGPLPACACLRLRLCSLQDGERVQPLP